MLFRSPLSRGEREILPFFLCHSFQFRINEWLQIAVEDALRVACFDVRPDILHHLVGVKDVAADLLPEVRACGSPFEFRFLLLVFRAFFLEELAPQHLHRVLAVLDLAAFALAADDRPRRDMGDAHRAFGLIHVLAARPPAAERVDPEFFGVDGDLPAVADFREDFDEREARLAEILCVEGGEAHEAMGTLLAF